MAAQTLRRYVFHTTGQLRLPGNFGPSAAVAQAIWWVCASDQRRKRCYAAGEDRNFLTTIWSDSGLYLFLAADRAKTSRGGIPSLRICLGISTRQLDFFWT